MHLKKVVIKKCNDSKEQVAAHGVINLHKVLYSWGAQRAPVSLKTSSSPLQLGDESPPQGLQFMAQWEELVP